MADADKSAVSGSAGLSEEELAIISLLKECGVQEYDNRVVSMLMDIQNSVTTKLVLTASGVSQHSEKSQIDAADVQTAVDVLGLLSPTAPNREKMLKLADDKNQQPLPMIRHNHGLKLPSVRFCQTQQNVMYTEDASLPWEVQYKVQLPSHLMEHSSVIQRTGNVQNKLKRRAPNDGFDS